MRMVAIFATFPRIILMATGSGEEAVNVIMSLLVTFLKNIPNDLWEAMRKVASDQTDENPTHAMFAHLDEVRKYKGGHYMEWEPEPNQPAFTSKPPTTPQ